MENEESKKQIGDRKIQFFDSFMKKYKPDKIKKVLMPQPLAIEKNSIKQGHKVKMLKVSILLFVFSDSFIQIKIYKTPLKIFGSLKKNSERSINENG